MFSHCVVLLIGTFIHTSHDHFIFYFLWITLSGAAGIKLALLISNQTAHPQHKVTIAAIALLIHMAFLLYLHFAYHELAEEVSHALFEKVTESMPSRLLAKTEVVVNKPPSVMKGIINLI
jgi:hypothetical protein